MTRTPVVSNELPLAPWGAALNPPRGRGRIVEPPKVTAASRPRPGRGGLSEVLAAVLLLVLWTLLWSVFLRGVVVPAARLERATLAEHPSLGVELVPPGAARQPAPRGGALPVDTGGGLP